jgi:hypothetical protein
MAHWARDADGIPSAEIDGMRYRARPHGHAQQVWVSEFLDRGRWERIGSMADSEDAAIRDAEDFAVYLVERAALARQERSFAPGKGTSTPWGKADHASVYGPGVTFYGTPRHGGFKVSKARNDAAPPALRNADGWYEEDCEWAKVALAFPVLFTARERRQAERSLRDWDPEAWEAHFGRDLEPGESMTKDDKLARVRHAGDWIVTAATISDERPGMVETWAKLGGDRHSDEERRFWIPAEEYSARGRIGFVVDTARHEEMGEPTSGPRP